jgi:hypothetical protein
MAGILDQSSKLVYTKAKETKQARPKIVLVIADLHCGHRTGLTPPEWWMNRGINKFYDKIHDFEKTLWEWFKGEVDKLKPFDAVIVNGDAIDGKGERSGGTEQITTDRNQQVQMAKTILEQIDAKKIFIINGTPYHVGKEDDFEAILAEEVKATYSNHEFIECEKVIFDVRHKISSSTVPYGRWTAPQKAALWNKLNAGRGIQPEADVILRSHVHYYTFSEDRHKTVITTPALQGWSKYGSRECEGTNDIGLLVFDCKDGQYLLHKRFFDMSQFKTVCETM